MWSNCIFELPGGRTAVTSFSDPTTLKDLLDKTPFTDGFVTTQGKIIGEEEYLTPGTRYSIAVRLRGGKGGFGSMLRAIGAQIEKTTNREACRDLSGRRMRDVNNEKKMVEYLGKKAQEESDREKRKLEKLDHLTQTPKHFFNDPEYENKLYEVVENVDKALEKGLVAEKKVTNKKRKIHPAEKREGPNLKRGLWLGVDDVSDSDSDEDLNTAVSKSRGDSSDSDAGPSSSKSNAMLVNLGTKQTSVKNSTDECISDETKLHEAMNAVEDISNNEKSVTEELNPVFVVTVSKSIQKSTSEPPMTAKKLPTFSSPLETPKLKYEEEQDMEEPSQEIDLSGYNTVENLEQLGLDKLKMALMKKGVKCGGSLKERAARLFLIKDLPPEQIKQCLKVKKNKEPAFK